MRLPRVKVGGLPTFVLVSLPTATVDADENGDDDMADCHADRTPEEKRAPADDVEEEERGSDANELADVHYASHNQARQEYKGVG